MTEPCVMDGGICTYEGCEYYNDGGCKMTDPSICLNCIHQYDCSAAKEYHKFCTPYLPIPEGFMRTEDVEDVEDPCDSCDLKSSYELRINYP